MSGPVRRYTDEEIEAMLDQNRPEHTRRNITAEDAAAKRAAVLGGEPAPKTLQDLQADGIVVLNREMRFCRDASDNALVAGSKLDAEVWDRFREVMTTIKQHLVEERQAGSTEREPSIEELRREAKKK